MPVEPPSVLGESTGPQLTCSTSSTVKCSQMRVLYIGGFNEKTDGSWATGPVVEELKKAGVKAIADNKVDYPALHGLPHLPSEGETDKAEQALVDYLNGLPKDDCFILVGYSTGVVAIEKALSSGGPALKSDVGPRILGIERFADPTNLERIPLIGTKPHDVGPEFADRALPPVCNEGDILCDPQGISVGDLDACQTVDLYSCLGGRPHLPPGYTEAAKKTAPQVASKALKACSARPSHTVVDGDTLWDLAVKTYGDGTKWPMIYEANRSKIEAAARDHGYASSHNGDLIFPGTALAIPPAA